MSILLFILILLVLIVGHELGHFVVAKLARIKVPEFGVGFPPKLWGISWRGTEYTINALPFGGFVKIFGEDATDSKEPGALASKSRWVQASVMAAGPLMNVALAFGAFFIAYTIGFTAVMPDADYQSGRVVVTNVLVGSPAAVAGIQPADQITEIVSAGISHPINTPADIRSAIGSSEFGVDVVLTSGTEQRSVHIDPVAGLVPEEPTRLGIGVGTALVGTTKMGVTRAFMTAASDTAHGLGAVATGLWGLITSAIAGTGSLDDVSGPVGIAGMAGDAAAFGAGQVFIFAALISLNLAVINLLPLPALDGGRLLMLLIEAVRGKSMHHSTTAAINDIGFLALIALMLVVTIHDISKLV